MSKDKVAIFWFRRDLRWEDNTGLYYSLNSNFPVIPIFIFDKNILSEIATPPKDRRVQFIYERLVEIHNHFQRNFGSGILVFHSTPIEVFRELIDNFEITGVYFNRDYEPSANQRDEGVMKFLKENNIKCFDFKDIVVFEPQEILTPSGAPYKVYTPYSKEWKRNFDPQKIRLNPSEQLLNRLYKFQTPPKIISYNELGFLYEGSLGFPHPNLDEVTLINYHKTRDFPYIEKGTTRLSLHLRFGTLSVRKIALLAKQYNEKLLNELIWREFYQSVLFHFPWMVSKNFNSKFDIVEWNFDEKAFEKWKLGETGFPLVDAGMRELNETGYMHNRVRMVVANFLTKILMMDWRLGEAYFREKLLDYEMASNVGNWQWAAGTGVDAAPYFRIFNPELQRKKFDPEGEYIKRWVPEAISGKYLPPMVDFEERRKKYLEMMKNLKMQE
ncbi:deoxyribodipyrimidine photo-lyase [Bacteroidetes/Chlorobi group bacterium MS-B_bin-24]|jgi:deoxyribodipyrimidine photo-lyase|nr:MAG: deoxyribodipyrimidine photo-lyase [Bacteroidetes/Chlorobi group bacterium MS-B_bin-24]